MASRTANLPGELRGSAIAPAATRMAMRVAGRDRRGVVWVREESGSSL
jgi:hypothetical protein